MKFICDTCEVELALPTYGNIAADDASGSTTFADADNLVASRIATYKALADKISEEVPGLRAYMVSETGGTNDDVLEDDDIFKLSTKDGDMIKGIIQIESLIPGVSFDITEVGEEIGNNNKVAGGFQTSSAANAGEGVGALNSARDALAQAISGKQQDVYTISDLGLADPKSSNTLPVSNFTYGLTIYDKELDKIIPVPGDNTTSPATPLSINISNATTIDDLVSAINASQTSYINNEGEEVFNSSYQLSDYVVAKNINGNLVIETKDENYDVEFSGSLKQLPGINISLNNIVDNAEYTFDINVDGIPTTFTVNNTIVPGDTLSATQIYGELRNQIQSYNLTAINPLELSPLVDGNFYYICVFSSKFSWLEYKYWFRNFSDHFWSDFCNTF